MKSKKYNFAILALSLFSVGFMTLSSSVQAGDEFMEELDQEKIAPKLNQQLKTLVRSMIQKELDTLVEHPHTMRSATFLGAMLRDAEHAPELIDILTRQLNQFSEQGIESSLLEQKNLHEAVGRMLGLFASKIDSNNAHRLQEVMFHHLQNLASQVDVKNVEHLLTIKRAFNNYVHLMILQEMGGIKLHNQWRENLRTLALGTHRGVFERASTLAKMAQTLITLPDYRVGAIADTLFEDRVGNDATKGEAELYRFDILQSNAILLELDRTPGDFGLDRLHLKRLIQNANRGRFR